MLPVNQVFRVGDKHFRLLWCDAETAFWIDLEDRAAWPVLIATSELENMLLDGAVEPAEDPFLDSTLREIEEGSPEWEKRESAWEMLRGEVGDVGLFFRKGRGPAVIRITQTHGVTHQTVYRLLKRYWQRGMCKNALLPDYVKSGAKGKARKPSGQKLGRPRIVRNGTGSNVTEDIARIFRQVIEGRLLKESHPVVTDAYASAVNLIRARFPAMTVEDLPTPEQFRYFFKREYTAVSVAEKQFTSVNFAKDVRPLKGTSTADTLGPGHRYQIDATIADIYLVSEQDRNLIVGRPVIYFVVDVFSRMVTGMYVGFEGPSWVSAMMALANAVTDKTAYCRAFGIDIEPEHWPVGGLPDVILADKGELNGTKVEPFAEAFGVRIENAPARRGDAKGIVERKFRTVQGDFKPYVPGVVGEITSRKRGGKDYRLDATLTLPEFTKQILDSVLYYNNYRPLSKYDRSEGMPGDLPAIPLALWRWGLTNLTGRLRQAPDELVRINLLPHDFATLSDRGIRLFGCYYTCAEAMKLGWFHRGLGQRPSKVQVAYDPRSADHIYVRPNQSLKDYWVCDLADFSRRFRGTTFWDVWNQTRSERKADANAAMAAIEERGKLLERMEEVTEQAEAQRPERTGLTKKDLGTQIRENKQQEKRHERRHAAFKPAKVQQGKIANVVPLKGGKLDDYAYPDMSDLIFGEGDDD
ncbi:Mu transposase C-terminal domain-containing protein [Aeromonas hydrophila]|uniref:Mu transposase C-terminal domain-containing protein n=1 Tax=Aeromonas hydrophila TaxID=644 RepID=UPI0020B45030|nr:Mu transposase C-terminal domain-containing protein [Aeromonas hydrophila]WEF01916.1 Mu transposase C-terminal domain-containing protein [Aeromonas hydrophila]CAD7560011.1 hypothetical protein KBAHV01_44160 [Aeromonas hydrophila]HDX8611251.1 transposase [Aeromonas hydrophila]HDX8613786.1 transposase [Aeromonas hydrophila]HDZ8923781.1 transposase [Aeromonas hydrophila]